MRESADTTITTGIEEQRRARRLFNWVRIGNALALVMGLIAVVIESAENRRILNLPLALNEFIQRDSAEGGGRIHEIAAMRRALLFRELEKKYGQRIGTLEKELPDFARARIKDAAIPELDRARAAYSALRYADAERLAHGAALAAKNASPLDKRRLIDAIELMVWSSFAGAQPRVFPGGFRGHTQAEYRIHYEAASLIVKKEDPLQWARLCHALTYTRGLYTYNGRREMGLEGPLREVIAIRTEKLGPMHPDTLLSRSLLGYMLLGVSRQSPKRAALAGDVLAEMSISPPPPRPERAALAEAEHSEVLAIRQRVLGPEHPDSLASLMALDEAQWALAKYSEVEARRRTILDIQQRVLGAEHPDTRASRSNLAVALNMQGKYTEAEAEYRTVLAILERVLGADPDPWSWYPEVARNCYNLALCLEAQGKNAEALLFAQRALGAWRETTHSYAYYAKMLVDRLEKR